MKIKVSFILKSNCNQLNSWETHFVVFTNCRRKGNSENGIKNIFDLFFVIIMKI